MSHTSENIPQPLSGPQTFGVRFLSFLGAIGIGIQNYMAVAGLLSSIANGILLLSQGGLALIHSAAVALGGLASGAVNFFINLELLEAFLRRIIDKRENGKKRYPELKGWWQKFKFWAGSVTVVTAGILVGLTAFAFGPIGALAAIGIAAGIFVAIVTTIQELEAWLQRFDDQDSDEKKYINILKTWWKELTPGKVIGYVIAIVNVLGLCLLMAMGVAAFMTGVGAPILPALIAGVCLAFTAGAFTSLNFYAKILSEFCGTIKEKWQDFKKAKLCVLGGIIAGINAVVNGVLTYVGVIMIVGMLAAASIAVPPIGAVIAVAVVLAVAATIASFILGIDFWTKNIQKLIDMFSRKKVEVVSEKKTSDTNPDADLDPDLGYHPDQEVQPLLAADGYVSQDINEEKTKAKGTTAAMTTALETTGSENTTKAKIITIEMLNTALDKVNTKTSPIIHKHSIYAREKSLINDRTAARQEVTVSM